MSEQNLTSDSSDNENPSDECIGEIRNNTRNCGTELNKGGWSPLHYAASEGKLDIVNSLISCGADVNAKGAENRTPLHACLILSGDVNIIRKLLESGADVNAKESGLGTAIHSAVNQKRNREVFEVLKEHGADLNPKDMHGSTPLHHAAWLGLLNAAKILIEFGADLHIENNLKRTPYIDAYLKGNRQLMDVLRKAAMNRLELSDDDWTPLHHAARENKFDAVKSLIENGHDVNAKGAENRTSLHLSVGDANIVHYLLQNGADVKAKDDGLKTALHWAVKRESDRDVYKVLVEYGADLNAKDSYGSTPLHYAAWLGFPKAAEILIELGANLFVENNCKRTPHIDAYLQGHKELIDMLRRAEIGNV